MGDSYVAELLGHCTQQIAVQSGEEFQSILLGFLSNIANDEAMGGKLQIIARTPNGNVRICQFIRIGQDESETASALG